MRLLGIFVLLVLSVNLLADDPAADRQRRVRVALALACPDVTTCGKCREDATAARLEAISEQRPLVLFVGDCGGLGCTAERAGAVAAKVQEYVGDNRPPTEQRVIILEPRTDKTGMWLNTTLPAHPTADGLIKAVDGAKPKASKAGVKLNWDF